MKKIKHKIIHPFDEYDSQKEIIVDIYGEVDQNCIPHGLCKFAYDKAGDTFMSFEGFGFMKNGVFHGGPLMLFN